MLNPTFFNSVFVFPILNLLVLLYKAFLFLKLPGSLGFAIIGLTALIRLLFQPFYKQQIEMTKKMHELKPHLDKLSEKHKDNKKALQEEQLKLYQKAGINPASGCLVMIIQLPIFFALYNTLSVFLLNDQAEKAIDQINNVLYAPFLKISAIDLWFFGFNLAMSPQKSGQWFYLLIPLITVILQYFQTISMTPQVTKQENKKNKEEASDDFQKAMNTQIKYIFPIMIGWFSYTMPVGLSLYWNIFSLSSMMQGKQLTVKKN